MIDDPYTVADHINCNSVPRSKGSIIDPYRENTYYRTWQLQHRGCNRAPSGVNAAPPPPYDPVTLVGGGTNQNARYSEHIYESPKFERREMAPHGTEEPSSVKYYELDINDMNTTSPGRDNQSTSTSGYRSDSLPPDRADL